MFERFELCYLFSKSRRDLKTLNHGKLTIRVRCPIFGHPALIVADEKLFCNICEWNVSFEIVSAFEWRLIIFVACLAYGIYKVRKPRMTQLGQGVHS